MSYSILSDHTTLTYMIQRCDSSLELRKISLETQLSLRHKINVSHCGWLNVLMGLISEFCFLIQLVRLLCLIVTFKYHFKDISLLSILDISVTLTSFIKFLFVECHSMSWSDQLLFLQLKRGIRPDIYVNLSVGVGQVRGIKLLGFNI